MKIIFATLFVFVTAVLNYSQYNIQPSQRNIETLSSTASSQEVELESSVRKSIERSVLISYLGGQCSGLIVQPGLVLTAKHCYENSVGEILIGGKVSKIKRVSLDADLALFEVETAKVSKVSFNTDPSFIEQTYVVGNAGEKRGMVQFGRISLFSKDDTFEIQRVGAPGFSGGGVYSYDGRLVGLMFGFYCLNKKDDPEAEFVVSTTVVSAKKIKKFLEEK